MKTNFNFSIALYLIAGTICLFLSHAANANPLVYIRNSQLYFDGEITQESVEQTMKLIDDNEPVQSMVINSMGGDIIPAMRLGYWIYDNQISLTIDEICASFCANYLLTAAKKVYINQGALTLWHGGATQKSLLPEEATAAELQLYQHKIELERAFFEHIGVDQKITVYGQLDDFSVMKHTPGCVAAHNAGRLQGWTYSIESLAKFGVINVTSQSVPPSVAYDGEQMVCIIEVE